MVELHIVLVQHRLMAAGARTTDCERSRLGDNPPMLGPILCLLLAARRAAFRRTAPFLEKCLVTTPTNQIRHLLTPFRPRFCPILAPIWRVPLWALYIKC